MTIEEAFPEEVEFVLKRGLMEYTDRALSMTPEGAKHFTGVVALFHAPSVKQYLVNRDPAAEDMHHNQRIALSVAKQTGSEMAIAR